MFEKLLGKFKRKHACIQFEEISKMPRYKPTVIKFFSKFIKIVDSASFLSQYKQIYGNEIYKFKADNSEPFIIDGGANIGLSILYFKQLYPNCKIIAFEPDKNIFKVLSFNIKTFRLKDVTLINKGLWNKEGKIEYFAEGADAGRIAIGSDPKTVKIHTVRLKNYLNKPVDFLKMDIEGAETKTIEDCSDTLINVKNLFIEYHSFATEPQTLDNLLKIIKQSYFRYYVSNAGVYTKHPFLNRNFYLGMDNQLNIYAIRK